MVSRVHLHPPSWPPIELNRGAVTRSQLKQLHVRVVVRLAMRATPHSPAGLADVCGGPVEGVTASPFSEAQCWAQ